MKASEIWSNLCFYGRCIKIVCQEWWRRIFAVALVMLTYGCANLNERLSAPYACARSPYYCTAEAWTDCVCAPFKLGNGNSQDPIWTCFATLTWPFWLVDEVAEVALDTVFLPVDGIYALCKAKPQQPQGEDEKVQEAR